MSDLDHTATVLHWLAAIEVPAEVVVTCHHTPLPSLPKSMAGVRVVACVADEGLALPAQLLGCGVERVWVVPCLHNPDAVVDRVADWRTVLDDVALWERPPAVRWGRNRAPVHVMGQTAISRRGVFGLGASRELPINPHVDEESRTIDALRILRGQGRAKDPKAAGDAPGSDATASDPARVGVELTASDCVACGVCVRACPHEALSLEHTGPMSTLSHRVDACRADLACVELCPAEALSAGRTLSLVELADRETEVLASVETAVCRRCGTRFPGSDSDVCAACAFRINNPFGSAMPAALGPSKAVPPRR